MRNNLFWGVAAVALMAPAMASAQETTATIRGSVTANGAPVAGAQVKITNVPSGTISNTSTDASGTFNASGLRAGGPYTVEVTSSQGSTQVTDIFTVVGQPYDLPVDLGAASAADIVVTASSIRGAGTQSDGPQTVLNQRDVSKVASVNRDIRDIERRSPFATYDRSSGGGSAVSFAGVNPRFNRFTIQGAQIGDNFGLNPDASPTRRGPVPFDAIDQVSVSIAPFDIRQSNFQGGVIDTTLLSGTNKYHVNGFYSQSTDGLQGNQIGSLPVVLPKYKSETYGVTASGPIIKDKLFFMVSWERNTDPRPLSPGAVNQVPNLTDAQVASVQSISKNVYNYDAGQILAVTNNFDEKIVGKIDWNITDGQRFSLSYINSFDSNDNLNNSSGSTTSPAIGLSSDAYKLTELLRAGIAQLNSDWTDRFSTETRFVYKSYTRGQDPEMGRGFAQFRVCTAPTSIVSGTDTATSCGTGNPVIALGPDISRQTNALFTDTYDGSFLMRLKAGDHDLKGLFEYVENRTTNAFLQYSAGSYYFDSLADFQARNASQFDYQNALTLDPNSTTSNFKYGTYSFGLQDDWAITPELRLTYGVREDLYGSQSSVIFNPNFYNRYGFSNTQSFKGLETTQPRISFNYKPTPRLSVRGGVGVFSGGTPDIYFSNSYSNSGFIQNRIASVIRSTATAGATTACTAPYTGANAAVCTAALNGVTGTTIPAAVNTFLTTNTASLLTAPTASVVPGFRIPSQTRATLSVDYRLFGVDLGADYVFSKVNNGVTFTDLRSRVVGVLPDGRPRYTFVPTPGAVGQTADTNTDIQIGNTDRGRSHIFTVRADKTFDWGLSIGGSYTWQDVKDVSNATSSVATSLYNAQAAIDPNNAAYGISSNETKWQFKYNVGFDHAFFRDYRTIFQLFGETRAGQHYSYSMQDTSSGRSSVFGTTGNTDHYLLYVPTSINDPLVTYAAGDTTTAAALDNLINTTNLKNYRGTITPKNIARARANTRIDLHLEQEIPTFLYGSRISVFADIENLTNLLNKNWGGQYYTGFPYTSAVVNVTCVSAAGTALTGVVGSATNPAGGCAKYQYSSFRAPTDTVNTAQSLYLIRIGARFKF